ncbi:sensor histidine kinase [Haloarcula halophila]|uniref:sensor histidine kinase n=1 Tax=Haloarcula halophila TaxID=3032584 RepID=UPI0023E3DB46|nr:HAMP domain-containing sensor histidine kinase [Halomicroarcula sp. DFY41]
MQGRLSLAVETGDISHLNDAIDSADRMEQLIDELLTLAREGEMVGETNPVDVGLIAEQAWENVDAPVASPSVVDSPAIEADAARLRELMENLFRNAVEHGSTGNRTASGDAVDHDPTNNRTKSGDPVEHSADHVTVTVGPRGADGFYVADDGSGVPESERERVFERGHTTSPDGTGFGLAIVEDIAQAHGWTIELTESQAGGARFEFRTTPDDR